MHPAEIKQVVGMKDVSKIELSKNTVRGVPRTSASVVNDMDSRLLIHRRSKSLTIRIREVECMLADIQFQIKTLQREKAYLCLVRAELGAPAIKKVLAG